MERPIEEWTLLEKLAEIATAPFGGPMPRCLLNPSDWARPMRKIAQEAFDEIVRLRAEVTDWQPLDTAPVEPAHTVPSYYRFRCLLQDQQGHVFEGAAYFVKPKPHLEPQLRWKSAADRQVFPKFWKPLPAPKAVA
jgi:hypothetical protein